MRLALNLRRLALSPYPPMARRTEPEPEPKPKPVPRRKAAPKR